VTAWLKVDYRKPTHADQFIVLRTRLVEGKGRKVWVEGQIEDLDGLVLVQASAMFVQPRYAKLLSSAALRQIMGEPEPWEAKHPEATDASPPALTAVGEKGV